MISCEPPFCSWNKPSRDVAHNMYKREPRQLQEFWTQLDIMIILAGLIQIILDGVGLSGDRPLDVDVEH